MISIESAETSNRGDRLSSSDVSMPRGEANDGGVAVEGVLDELASRLGTAPCLLRCKREW